MLLNNDLRLNLFGLASRYHFDMMVFICLEKTISFYFDEVQKISIRNQEV